METKRSYSQLFVYGILNAFWELHHLKMLINFQICSYWKRMKTVFCKQHSLFLCLSPSPSLCLLTELMTENLYQGIAISRSIWGAQIVQNIPKIQSHPFFAYGLIFPSVSLPFALLSLTLNLLFSPLALTSSSCSLYFEIM